MSSVRRPHSVGLPSSIPQGCPTRDPADRDRTSGRCGSRSPLSMGLVRAADRDQRPAFPLRTRSPKVSEGTAKPPTANRMRLLEGGGGDGELAPRAAEQTLARPRAALPTATGLSFDALLPFRAWSAIGARIARHSSATTWWLGDWLIYGQAKYGRHYKEAIAATGLDYQTLRNYAMVARRFEMSRRRDG